MIGPSLAGAARPPRFLTLSIARELGILLCLSLMFPFLIHVIPVPEESRLGSRLLPMFYAPLLAALLRRPAMAAAVALLAPWLNWAVTAHPAPLSAILMTVELLVFVLAVRVLLAKAGPHWHLAAPAYLLSMAAAALVVSQDPALVGGAAAFSWAWQCVATGLPGIGVLVLINWLVLRYYPPAGSGGGPVAA